MRKIGLKQTWDWVWLGLSLVPYFTKEPQQQQQQLGHRSQWNVSDNFAISQYPRPGVYPTEFPNSDRPRLRDIKIMGYSLRISHFRYTIWLEFNARTFERSKFEWHSQFVFISFRLIIIKNSINFWLDWNRFYGEELYDHSTDPDEYTNLYDQHEFAAIKLQLKHLLRTKLDN